MAVTMEFSLALRPDRNRQLCWAHLKRDFQKIFERVVMQGILVKDFLMPMTSFLNSGKRSMRQIALFLNTRIKN